MIRKHILTFLLLGTSYWSYSQRSTFIGTEVAITHDRHMLVDPCDILGKHPTVTGYFGFTLGQQINKTFLMETGLIRKTYDFGFGFKPYELLIAAPSGNGFNAWQIPLRLRSRVQIYDSRLFFSTTIGLNWNVFYGFGGGGARSSLGAGIDRVSYEYRKNQLEETFYLAEISSGIDYEFKSQFAIYANLCYAVGFREIHSTDIITENASCRSDQASTSSKGNYWGLVLGVKYDLSHLWSKEEEHNP